MRRVVFAVGSLAFYMVVEFVVIACCIMGSYKVYRLMEIGKQVFYPKRGIVPVAW